MIFFVFFFLPRAGCGQGRAAEGCSARIRGEEFKFNQVLDRIALREELFWGKNSEQDRKGT